jgi:hypothetical protein
MTNLPLTDGIYLGFPHDDYLADPALGSSSIKSLAYNPAVYWYHSPLNPSYQTPVTTPAQKLGTAFHTMVLDGPEAFKARYIMEPGPLYLRTVAELNFFVTERGGKASKLKADAIKAALAIDPKVEIYEVAVQAARDAGMEILDEGEWTQVVRATQAIIANPALTSAVSGGQSEVSVFWTEMVDGVAIRQKCRFDYLKPRASVDLKTIRPTFGRSFEVECRRSIANWRYDLQAEHYRAGRVAFAEHWRAGRVFGPTPYDPDENPALEAWGSACAQTETFAFVFVFLSSDAAPITWACALSSGVSGMNPILALAGLDRERALAAYARCSKQFEAGQPWLEYQPLEEIDINDLPAWFGR